MDFNFCAGRDRETKVIATLRSPKTGRRMDVITDQPGVQCYTGQGLDNTGKDGVHYGPTRASVWRPSTIRTRSTIRISPAYVLQAAGHVRHPDHLPLWRAE